MNKFASKAAHCYEHPPSSYYALLGRFNISDDTETDSIRREFTSIIKHEDYKQGNQSADADIALLRMTQSVSYSQSIQPICLPPAGINTFNIAGTVVGYGKSENFDKHETQPKQITINSVDLYTCYLHDFGFVQIASMRSFCAGKNQSPCSGDSGSGFYVKSKGQWSIYGIISEGVVTNGECDTSKYVVFVDVGKFIGWISQSELKC